MFNIYYKVSDHYQVKDIVISYFKEQRVTIINILHKISSKISLTTDIWISTINYKAFLRITIYYIDHQWKFHQFLLDIVFFNMCHIGVNIANEINRVLVEFNLLNKTLALTTNNKLAMLVCGQVLANSLLTELDNQSFYHYRCTAYVLNLAAHHGLEVIEKEIANMHTLISKIKVLTRLYDKLRNLCAVHKLDYLKPELDIEMR
ncbi:21825_t:CDS:1 [Cetraspora pellucida]|uniref:21825_t:CDS:1 n=1 Tax=Cetraspora pellucida TaxID=1433469 RepID=A0A9N8VKX9_9GLOM|nr:21825_t:CDS:1 [Cetraspora pellucida]